MNVLAATIARYGLFANMVALQFASQMVLWFTGFRWISRTTGLSLLTFVKRNTVSILILSVLAFVLASSLNRTVAQPLYETSTRFTLEQEIIRAIVRGPQFLHGGPGRGYGSQAAQAPDRK